MVMVVVKATIRENAAQVRLHLCPLPQPIGQELRAKGHLSVVHVLGQDMFVLENRDC